MNSSRRREHIMLTVKWLLYSLVIIMCTVIVTAGNGNGTMPLLLIPVSVSIAMSQNELVSGIIGAVCGILLDVITAKALGFNAIIMLVSATLASFLFLHLLKKNILNVVAVTAVVSIIQGLCDCFFNYILWDTEKYRMILTDKIIPSEIKTILSTPIVYLVIKIITVKLSPEEKIEVEQK